MLVVWLLLGWVRSQEGSADSTSRHRRDHQRRKTLEKLAARGLTGAEQERIAEEILARLDFSSSMTTTTTTTTTTTPPHLRPHRHRHHHHLSPRLARLASEMADEPLPESASLRHSPEVFEDATEETDLTVEEEDEVERDSSSPQLIEQYMLTETMESLNRGKRERIEAQERRNSRKNRRNDRKQECQKRRERCKELRKVKRIRRRRYREVRKMINDTIELYEDEDGTKYIDCCPSVLISINKEYGKGRSHRTMAIKPGHQAFTERMCMDGFEGKECIFPASALKPEVTTRCVQQYSYSQAIIKPLDSGNDEWMHGSIQVGSGCSCQVSINHKKKKRKRKKR